MKSRPYNAETAKSAPGIRSNITYLRFRTSMAPSQPDSISASYQLNDLTNPVASLTNDARWPICDQPKLAEALIESTSVMQMPNTITVLRRRSKIRYPIHVSLL